MSLSGRQLQANACSRPNTGGSSATSQDANIANRYLLSQNNHYSQRWNEPLGCRAHNVLKPQRCSTRHNQPTSVGIWLSAHKLQQVTHQRFSIGHGLLSTQGAPTHASTCRIHMHVTHQHINNRADDLLCTSLPSLHIDPPPPLPPHRSTPSPSSHRPSLHIVPPPPLSSNACQRVLRILSQGPKPSTPSLCLQTPAAYHHSCKKLPQLYVSPPTYCSIAV